MAVKIEENTRYRIVKKLLLSLMEISIGTGYNTQPLVTDDFRVLGKRDVPFAIYVEESDENPVSQSTSLGFTMRFTVNLIGFARIKNIEVYKARNMLLQDVRNCLTVFVGELHDDGIPTAFEFGVSSVDDSELTENQLAMFEQPVEFEYKVYSGNF